MNAVQFAEYVRLKTKTNSTTFTNSDIVIFMRQRQDELAERIIEASEDIILIPQVTSLVADQREYPLPSDILSRIKRLEIKFNGTDWIPLTEIDITEIDYPISTEANITDRFNNLKLSGSNPYGARFDLMRKSINIYSGTITTVANGLKLWCDTYPTAVTDMTGTTELDVDPSTTTHGIPRPFHRLWAMGVIIDYRTSQGKPIPLSESEQRYDLLVDEAIVTMKRGNLDREILASVPCDDGWDY